MPEITTAADESLDYPFLLVTHMVCADQQIHSQEAKALHELAKLAKVGQKTIAEMEKILAQDEYQISVETVARKVLPGQQNEAMRQMLALAYIDGFFAPLEREIVKQVAGIWHWSESEIQRLIEEAEGFTTKYISKDNDQAELSVGARLLKGAESILSPSLVSKLAEIAPENVGRRIEQLQQEILALLNAKMNG